MRENMKALKKKEIDQQDRVHTAWHWLHCRYPAHKPGMPVRLEIGQGDEMSSFSNDCCKINPSNDLNWSDVSFKRVAMCQSR